ncbi:MAG: hypothetical protein QOG68_152, partial [Solirubrobacteraceae bacterium]|nr:hypothetical protein [Solirubrobacteraceae bacterium]
MPTVRQPAHALRDRAERHVFEHLPDLPAVERRVLALLELAGADRAETARETGLDPAALSVAAATARKALRRARGPLAAGARCERAEHLLSDRHDLGLDRHDRKWLEIHMARCPRCSEHETLLEDARAELRASVTAEPKALPPAPAKPAIEQPARLRVVPPPVADEPPAGPPADVERTVEPRGGAEVSTRRTDVAEPPAAAVARRRRVSPAAKRAARIVAILLVLIGLVAGIGAGL